MQPRVKRLTENDTDLLRECAVLERGCISEPWSFESFLSEAQKPGGIVLAAVSETGEVCGLVTGCCILDEAEITNVAVVPECRRSGIGGMLLEAFFAEVGGASVFLEVRESNVAAIGLYRKFGFAQIGVRKRFYNNPVEDAVLMVRRHSYE